MHNYRNVLHSVYLRKCNSGGNCPIMTQKSQKRVSWAPAGVGIVP